MDKESVSEVDDLSPIVCQLASFVPAKKTGHPRLANVLGNGQWRSAILVSCIQIRIMFKQNLDNFQPRSRSRYKEGSFSSLISGIDGCSSLF
jgi:hypothetical protein